MVLLVIMLNHCSQTYLCKKQLKHYYYYPPRYPIEIFRKLLQIASSGYFLDKGKLYCQVDGVTTGSPLGPTLGNFFMAQLENHFLNTNLYFLPVHY